MSETSTLTEKIDSCNSINEAIQTLSEYTIDESEEVTANMLMKSIEALRDAQDVEVISKNRFPKTASIRSALIECIRRDDQDIQVIR